MSDATMSEAEWEQSVAELAARASRGMLYLVGAIRRAQHAARFAEAAGVAGAINLLPAFVRDFDPAAPGVLELIQEPALRGLVTADEANKLMHWEGAL